MVQIKKKKLEAVEVFNSITLYVLCSPFAGNNTITTLEEASTFCCAAVPLRLSDLSANYVFS